MKTPLKTEYIVKEKKLKKALNSLRLEVDGSIVNDIQSIIDDYVQEVRSIERNRAIRIYATLQGQGFPVSLGEFGIAVSPGKEIPLTSRQKQIFEYVRQLEIINLVDVAKHFDMAVNSVYGHFKALEKKGYMKNNKNEVPAWIVL